MGTLDRRALLTGIAAAAAIPGATMFAAKSQAQAVGERENGNYDTPRFTLEDTRYDPSLTDDEKESVINWLPDLRSNPRYSAAVASIKKLIAAKERWIATLSMELPSSGSEFKKLKSKIPRLNKIMVAVKKATQDGEDVCRINITFELLEPDQNKRESPDDPQVYEFVVYNEKDAPTS